MLYNLILKIFFLSTLILFVSLSAEETMPDTNNSDPLVTNMTNTWIGDLDGMIKDRVIRVLVIPSQIMFHVDKGKKSGFTYDLTMLFEKEINKNHKPKKKHLKTRIIFIPVAKDQLIPGLLKGRGDIAIADISITPKRKNKIDFSDPYAQHIDVITVTGPSSPTINTLVDLAGKEVYAQHSSSYYEYLQKMNFYFLEAGLEMIKIKAVPESLNDKDILEMLNAGLIGITVMDEYKVKFWAKVMKKLVVHDDIELHFDDSFAWMIRKKSPKLMKEINAFIKKYKEGTKFGNILIRRHVDNFKFLKPTINKKKLKKFDKVVEIFKKYAERYDLNYLLMIAQAYQESKLNQKAKSHVGALGVMQLMPATGKDMKVGNIKKLDPNIHAGIKYHRWIIDHYFKNEKIDALNQTMFAFAAYNAGPGRVRSLRKIAKKRGYDPNIWFNNVEVIAAEKIGAETVTYVSNIYEYYVAYYLYIQREEEKQEQINKVISTGKLK